MHIGNSLICPVTGIPMLVLAGGSVIYAIKNIKNEINNKINGETLSKALILGAFVFVLQMLNFSFSEMNFSVHIIGAIFLCKILGKNLAFVVMSLILALQSLLFNDGGVLALGCNIFNMGFLPCYVVYPLFSKITKNESLNLFLGVFASVILAVVALGAEIFLSGSIKTPALALSFLNLMIVFHLFLVVFESIFTILASKILKTKKSYTILAFVSLVLSVFASKLASLKPDGLEWTLIKLNDDIMYQISGKIYNFSQILQSKTALFEDSSFGGAFVVCILVFFAFLLKKGNECQETK